MSFTDVELLRHIDEELKFILNISTNKSREEVLGDAVLSRAVVRSLEIIGEAAKKISSEFKILHPEIEWKKVAGTRDKLIHEYFGVDYDIVWDIIKNKLPALLQSVVELLPK